MDEHQETDTVATKILALQDAIFSLRSRGYRVERSDFPISPILPGLYMVDGRELTEMQVLSLASQSN